MLVSDMSETNGVTSFAVNYFKRVDPQKVHIDFAAYFPAESSHPKWIEAHGGRVYLLPPLKDLKRHVAACERILAEGQYDVVHANSLHITIPMLWCAKRRGVPVRILHSHSSKLGGTRLKSLRNWLFLPLLRAQATDYAACAEAAGRRLFGKRPYTIIPNVISVARFQYDPQTRAAVRAEMHAESKLIVGSAGRLAVEKNPLFAMDVFQKLSQAAPNAEYWWAGTGPLEPEVRQYIAQLGLTEKVRLLGNRRDMDRLYQAMDVFFMPSLFEGLSLACLEAEAAGLPCVVSDTVSSEVNVTGEVTFVPLQGGLDAWVEQLLRDPGQEARREARCQKVDASIYSDRNAGRFLYEQYLKFLQKKREIE